MIFPKPSEQTMTLEQVTPEIAAQWLEGGDNWRILSRDHVRRLVDTIRVTGWWNNGKPFIFAKSGRQIDGQHRSAAIVQLGITVWAWVMRGADEIVAAEIDIFGKPRTIAQYLQKQKEPCYKELAAIIYYFMAHQQEQLAYPQNATRTLHDEIRCFEDNQTMRRSAKAASASTVGFKGAVGFLHYLASKSIDAATADLFIDKLFRGVDLSEDDPIRLLRNRLLNDRAAKEKLIFREKMALMIVAWNKWIQGKPVGQLKWRGTGPKAEPFPAIVTTKESES